MKLRDLPRDTQQWSVVLTPAVQPPVQTCAVAVDASLAIHLAVVAGLPQVTGAGQTPQLPPRWTGGHL